MGDVVGCWKGRGRPRESERERERERERDAYNHTYRGTDIQTEEKDMHTDFKKRPP